MQPNWTCTYGRRGLLVPGKLLVLYLSTGGGTAIISRDVPRSYRVFDPKTGQVVGRGRLADKKSVQVDSGSRDERRVLVFTRD